MKRPAQRALAFSRVIAPLTYAPGCQAQAMPYSGL